MTELRDYLAIKPNPNGTHFSIRIMRFYKGDMCHHGSVTRTGLLNALCRAYEMRSEYKIDMIAMLDPYGQTCLEFNDEDGILDVLMNNHEWW